jgi:hypothetical protein
MSLPKIYSADIDLFNGIVIKGNTGSLDFVYGSDINLKLKDDGKIYMPNINEYSVSGISGATGIVLFEVDSGQLVYSTDFSGLDGMTGPTGASGLQGPTGTDGRPGFSNTSTLFLDSATQIYTTSTLNGTLLLTPNTGTQTTISSGNRSNTTITLASFLMPQNTLTTTAIIGGLWSMNLYAFSSETTGTAVKYYINLYYVDANGNNQVTLATGTALSATTVLNQNIYTYDLYVPAVTLPNLTYRIKADIVVVFAGNSKNITLEFRDNTMSHLHTTLLSNSIGNIGVQGPTGPTGYIGPAGANTTIQYNNSSILAGDTGMTFNNTTKTLTVDNILSNVSNKVNTSYSIPVNTTLSIDNIDVRITTGGIPQVQSITGSFTACYSGYTCKGGSTFTGYTVTSATIDNISWTNISSTTLSNAGDTIGVNFQNKSDSKIYRITYYQVSNPPETEAYAISIEQII